MKIAITGANGFVGTRLTRHLSEAYPEDLCVYPVVRPKADLSDLEPAPNLRTIDFDDLDSISSAISECDIIIHNAGKTKAISMEQMYQANVLTTANLIKAINLSPTAKQLILISSQAAGRPSYDSIPVTESDKSSPLTWYGKSKLLAELTVKNTCKVPWTIIRPCSVYGDGEKDFLQLFRLLNRGLSVQAGNSSINLIHISELCDFIALCLANPDAEGEIFYVTNGARYYQSDLIQAALSALGKKAIEVNVPPPIFKAIAHFGDLIGSITGKPQLINSQKLKEIQAPGWLCSCEKAQKLLGWEPRPNIYESLRETITWYKENGYL